MRPAMYQARPPTLIKHEPSPIIIVVAVLEKMFTRAAIMARTIGKRVYMKPQRNHV